jgi:hypothetical protein
MGKRILELEDEEITRLYNEAYGNSNDSNNSVELAEELLNASAVNDEVDEW